MKNNNYQYLSLEDIFLQFVSIICLIVHLSTIFCRTIESPLPQPEMKDIPNNQCLCVLYKDPVYDDDHLFPAKVLPETKFDVIECGDVEKLIKKKDNQLQIIYYTMPVQKRCTIL